MASTVDIWNMALNLVGDGFITDQLEESTEAELCKLHYPFALDFVLESRDWNFSTKRIEIAESTDAPVFGFYSAFKVPTDCSRVIEVWESKSYETNNRYVNNPLQWQIEGEYIAADTSDQVWVKYIERVEDPNRFTSSFTLLLATYLASRLATPVASNASLKQSLMAEFAVMLDEASANDAMSGRTKTIRSNVLMGARFR